MLSENRNVKRLTAPLLLAEFPGVASVTVGGVSLDAKAGTTNTDNMASLLNSFRMIFSSPDGLPQA